MATVGQYPVTTFTTPVNGTSPIDANQVRTNDNTIKTAYNSHDADATIHLQSSAVASRPAAGTAGRNWLSTDTGLLYAFYDTGAAWVEWNYVRSSPTSAVTTARALGGSTSWAVRNNADSADNLLVSDAGAVTARTTVTATTALQSIGGFLNLSSYVGTSKLVGGTLGHTLRNNGDTANNFIVTDAGDATIRGGLTITASGLVVTAGGVTVSAGGASIIGNSSVTGTLAVSGSAGSGGAAITAAVGTTTSAAESILSGTATWNSGGVTFTAVKVNVTNTASAAASMLVDLQVGGISQFNVTRAGLVACAGVNSSSVYQYAGTQVVSARKTGWAVATGTATRTTFDTATVTLPLLAERVKALIDDLHATAGHGLIGT